MRISAELRDEAAALGEEGMLRSDGGGAAALVEDGLARKAREFREKGSEIYTP